MVDSGKKLLLIHFSNKQTGTACTEHNTPPPAGDMIWLRVGQQLVCDTTAGSLSFRQHMSMVGIMSSLLFHFPSTTLHPHVYHEHRTWVFFVFLCKPLHSPYNLIFNWFYAHVSQATLASHQSPSTTHHHPQRAIVLRCPWRSYTGLMSTSRPNTSR